MDRKCDKHGAFYEVEQLNNGKTREYCPLCREEEFSPMVKFLMGNTVNPLRPKNWPPPSNPRTTRGKG